MRALILAAGRLPDRATLDLNWPGWGSDIELVVAADGGARTAERLGLRTDLLVGDLDSIDPVDLADLRRAAIPIEEASTTKDESDTELAILAALARGADRLTIVGGLGGRADHLLANIGLLALPALVGRSVELLDGSTRVTLIRGPGTAELTGRTGDLVSLLPLGPGVEGVTSEGLAWPLEDEPLPVGPARGLSNRRTAPIARVSVRAGLLVAIESVEVPSTSARLP
jgi:thiamine pyrophosphokinase